MEEPHAGAAGLLELAFVVGRVHLGDDSFGIGMARTVADDGAREPGPIDAGQCRVETLRILRMPDAGVVPMKDRVCVDGQHGLWSLQPHRDTTARRLKRILQIAAIVALTIFFLVLFLRNANLSEVWAMLKTTSPGWLALALLVNFSALLFRTIRWRIILDHENPPPFYATFFANTVGYMLSTILPVRVADAARPALLARRTTHRFSRVLGTVLTERVLDLFSILSLFIFFAVLRWDEFSHDSRMARWFYIVKAGAIASAVLLVALGVLIFGLYFFRPRIRRAHEFLGRALPKRFRDPWMHFFDSFVDTLELTRHGKAFAFVLLCTAGVWACLTGQFYLTTLAVHRPLPFDASFFVTGVTTVGLAIPTPGGIGGFHKACQLVLTNFYHFDVDSSVATAVLFHIVGTLPVLVAGLLLIAHEGLRWRDVKRSAETTEPEPPATEP